MCKVRNALILLTLAAAILVPIGDAFAQRGGRGGGGGGGGNRGGGGGGGNYVAPRPDPNLNPTVIADRQEITTTQNEIAAIVRQIDAASKTITTEFEKTDEFVVAKKGQDEANAELNAAREAVIKELKSKPDYKAALDKETAAKAKIEQLRSKNAPRDQIAAQSQEVLNAGNLISKIEREALAANPRYTAAQKKQTEALAGMKTVRDALAEKIKAAPDVSELKTKQAEAVKKLADLRKKLEIDFAQASQG